MSGVLKISYQRGPAAHSFGDFLIKWKPSAIKFSTALLPIFPKMPSAAITSIPWSKLSTPFLYKHQFVDTHQILLVSDFITLYILDSDCTYEVERQMAGFRGNSVQSLNKTLGEVINKDTIKYVIEGGGMKVFLDVQTISFTFELHLAPPQIFHENITQPMIYLHLLAESRERYLLGQIKIMKDGYDRLSSMYNLQSAKTAPVLHQLDVGSSDNFDCGNEMDNIGFKMMAKASDVILKKRTEILPTTPSKRKIDPETTSSRASPVAIKVAETEEQRREARVREHARSSVKQKKKKLF